MGSHLPRYFFHIYDEHGAILDDEGMELPDEAAARHEGQISAQELPNSLNNANRRIEVLDSSGVVLAILTPRLPFS